VSKRQIAAGGGTLGRPTWKGAIRATVQRALRIQARDRRKAAIHELWTKLTCRARQLIQDARDE
jgi:CRISPR/Cas system CSM-associated protein Csm3 (group 7 of RAMP superfamily)